MVEPPLEIVRLVGATEIAKSPFTTNVIFTVRVSVPLVARIKRAVNEAGFTTPVIAAGGISTFAQAEQILRLGQADIVGMARQALADPDWFRKVRQGRGDEVRRCTYTNYCEALDQAHRPVTCKLWDRVDLDEPGIATVDDGRRRLEPPAWR